MLRRTQKGFTLIELLVVISVIAILTAIVISNLSSGRRKARDTSAITSLSEAGKQAMLFHVENGYTYSDGTMYLCNRTHYYPGLVVPPNTSAEFMNLIFAATNANRLPLFCSVSTYELDRWQSFYTYIHLAAEPDKVFCIDSTGFAGKIDCSSTTLPFETDPGNGLAQCGSPNQDDFTCQ